MLAVLESDSGVSGFLDSFFVLCFPSLPLLSSTFVFLTPSAFPTESVSFISGFDPR